MSDKINAGAKAGYIHPMFTGIIETTGTLVQVVPNQSNVDFHISSRITGELQPDQSVAHDGVCLTVTTVSKDHYTVTAVAETLSKTTLGSWQAGTRINLERAMQANSRIDGHFVQGHVDTTGICSARENRNGSWLFSFQFPATFAALVIEKGSVCINGISLTAFDVSATHLSVAIIPYTFAHTGFQWLREGDQVNIEFDVLGKYVLRHLQINPAVTPHQH